MYAGILLNLGFNIMIDDRDPQQTSILDHTYTIHFT